MPKNAGAAVVDESQFNAPSAPARFGIGNQLERLLLKGRDQLLLFLAVLFEQSIVEFPAHQSIHHAGRAGGIAYVQRGPRITRRNAYRGVTFAGRRAADQQG